MNYNFKTRKTLLPILFLICTVIIFFAINRGQPVRRANEMISAAFSSNQFISEAARTQSFDWETVRAAADQALYKEIGHLFYSENGYRAFFNQWISSGMLFLFQGDAPFRSENIIVEEKSEAANTFTVSFQIIISEQILELSGSFQLKADLIAAFQLDGSSFERLGQFFSDAANHGVPTVRPAN
jgi:hypothetical protein